MACVSGSTRLIFLNQTKLNPQEGHRQSTHPTSLSSSTPAYFPYPGMRNRTARTSRSVRMMANPVQKETQNINIEKYGVKIIRNPPESLLKKLDVYQWPKYQFAAGDEFKFTNYAVATFYLLEGKAKVYPEASKDVIEIGAGDLVEFKKRRNYFWDVSVAMDKHYNFKYAGIIT
ncbi:hypothetical protein Tsubulata_017048 [Turnera subulata]|uniref:(S)-ureidoglycine aminohydrolase cupin domain-containing protein n=1 Tax=Turnera subulata TaxID=218843 RepID=A0A9Q0F3Y2_9ROSI|nr:hypothetical protein Tsubulata_017048 [Turnera subulata]